MTRVLSSLGIDGRGLVAVEREYLQLLLEANRPISLANLASCLGMSKETLREAHEPYLVRLGLVTTTREGRIACAT